MVTVCLTCGDQGFEEALVYCLSCEACAVHRYCLPVIPENFNEHISWFCDDCDGSNCDSHHIETDQIRKLGFKSKKKDNSGLYEKKRSSTDVSPEDFTTIEDHRLEIQQRDSNVEPKKVGSSSINETSKDSGGRFHKITGFTRTEASANDEESDSPKDVALADPSNGLQRSPGNRQTALGGQFHGSPNPGQDLRALPIISPIWKGSLDIKQNGIDSVSVIAHLSSLSCTKVWEAARSLPSCLSAKLLPRLDIWPKSFLRVGGPSDESIALFLFPINRSDAKDYEALIDEMMYNELAARTVLQNAELLIFTSYTLPMRFWRYQSKYYLWGVFRGRQSPSCSKRVSTKISPL